MKKIISMIAIILFVVIIIPIKSLAVNTNMELSFNKTKIKVGDEVKLSIVVNDFLQDGEHNAIEFKLTYDPSKLEYKSIKGINDWAMQASKDGTGFVGAKSGDVRNTEKIAEITFKVNDKIVDDKINILASDILVAVDIKPEIELADVSDSIEVIESKDNIKVIFVIAIIILIIVFIFGKKVKLRKKGKNKNVNKR